VARDWNANLDERRRLFGYSYQVAFLSTRLEACVCLGSGNLLPSHVINNTFPQHGSGQNRVPREKGQKDQRGLRAASQQGKSLETRPRVFPSAGLLEVCAVGWREIWALQVSGR
jgi:hypothetical protein